MKCSPVQIQDGVVIHAKSGVGVRIGQAVRVIFTPSASGQKVPMFTADTN